MKPIFALALVCVLLASCASPATDTTTVVDSAMQTLTAQPLAQPPTPDVEQLAQTAIVQTMIALTPPARSVEEIAGTAVAQTLTAINGALPTQPPYQASPVPTDTPPASGAPAFPSPSGEPQIVISSVPAIGVRDAIYGQVEGVNPNDHVVAIYIHVGGGWWTKPTWANPTVSIDDYGEWSCYCFNDGSDEFATEIRAYLIPANYTPPSMSGGGSMPSELVEMTKAMAIFKR